KVPSFVQTSEHMKTPRTSVKPVEHPTPAKNLRKDIPKSRGHKHSWNSKACFVCKSVNHLIKDCDYYKKKVVQKPVWNHAMRVNHQNSTRMTHPYYKKHVVPTAVLTRNPKGGKIIGKGKIRTGKLDFNDVYFVKELKFNLFSVSQMCDKKNIFLFTDTECVVLSSEFKLPYENHVLLRVPRENNMYNVDLKYIVPSGYLTCLFAKVTLDESNLWHRRLGHINLKTMNKLVKDDLIKGLPSKVFKNNHTCVACKKGKQHRASCKTKPVCSVSQPLQRLHMDLFGPTFVNSLNKKSYCLVVTDDYSRFSWVFFLSTKDETNTILKTFITGIENQINHKVKIIRSDNGTEFKNHDLNQFCGMKGIKREFSVARTPQQNRAEAVNTACYVQNRVLVTKPHNKTPYELLLGRTPSIGFMRPFGCPVTILNTLDPLGKFDGKADEGFLVGYSISNGHIWLFDIDTLTQSMNYQLVVTGNQPTHNAGNGHIWLFDIDTLTQSMNYQPVVTRNQPTHNADDKEDVGAEADFSNFKTTITVSPIPTTRVHKNHLVTQIIGDLSSYPYTRNMARMVKEQVTAVGLNSTNSTNSFNAAGTSDNAVSPNFEIGGKSSFVDPSQYPYDPDMPALEDIIYSDDKEDVGAEADFSNFETTITVSPIPTTRVHKNHPVTQIIGDLSSYPYTRNMARMVKEQGGLNQINDEDFHTCMFACFLSQEEPKRVHQALKDPSWIKAIQEGLL
nr:hypothetical protein [Tanacetum cinerariifolium]